MIYYSPQKLINHPHPQNYSPASFTTSSISQHGTSFAVQWYLLIQQLFAQQNLGDIPNMAQLKKRLKISLWSPGYNQRWKQTRFNTIVRKSRWLDKNQNQNLIEIDLKKNKENYQWSLISLGNDNSFMQALSYFNQQWFLRKNQSAITGFLTKSGDKVIVLEKWSAH